MKKLAGENWKDQMEETTRRQWLIHVHRMEETESVVKQWNGYQMVDEEKEVYL